MSFADYTSLKTAVATDWLHRTDLTSQAADFIALFESDFNAEMRVRQMEAETSQISTAGYLQHPTGWIGWKEIRGTENGVQYNLRPVTDEIAVQRTAGQSTRAEYYKVTGDRTYLYPAKSGVTFPAKYYVGVGLTSGTNWLLTAFPGAYLYGSLLQATAFIGDDPRIGLWKSAYDATMEKIKAASRKQSWSGQVLRMNPDINVR